MAMTDIRLVEPRDTGVVAGVLGRAFVDNPGYLALLGHLGAGRLRGVERVKRGFTEAAARHQEAHAAWQDGKIVGASLVSGPGHYPPGVRAKVWQATGCVACGPRAVRNFLFMDAAMAKSHARIAGRGPHYYLFVLGVAPERQGRGIGKSMLHHLSARADARGLPCYLETDKPSSVRLYESVGYEVVEENTMARFGGLKMWMMLRPPKG